MGDAALDRSRRVVPLRTCAGDVRARLLRGASRSPHDFIREIPLEADWRHWVERQTSEQPEATDLRLVWDGPGGEVAVFATRLPWDSAFFGVQTARLDAIVRLDSPGYLVREDLTPAIRDATEFFRSAGVEYLFGAVDSRDAAVCRGLSEHGYGVIESRLTHFRNLQDFVPEERYATRLAGPADIPLLQDAAVRMVNTYDRFHADPRIPLELADRLMAKWVQASVTEGFADATVVPAEGAPTAFCTVKYHRDLWEPLGVCLSQTVFGAVSSERKGWYRKLISEIHCMFKAEGVQYGFLVTQPSNRPVLRTWEHLGFQFGRNELVFRKWLGDGDPE